MLYFLLTSGKREFNSLSGEAKKFVNKIEEEIGLKVAIIGTGQELEDIIDLR